MNIIQMRADDNPTLSWALDYVKRGWKVFPLHGLTAAGLCTCGSLHPEVDGKKDRDAGKHPALPTGLKRATADMAEVAGWFTEHPEWNIGIRTGEASGMTVLDVDVGEGKSGAETWAGLIAEKGEPETLLAMTGGGGMHLFFAYNSSLKTSTNTLGPGVDCRNDGGYVVAAPSRHRSGATYRWTNWDAFPASLAALPAHLSVRVETRGRKKGGDPTRKRYTVEQVEKMLEHIDPGDRDMWRSVGIILGREFERAEAAWSAYVAWSDSFKGTKGRGHDEIMKEAFYKLSSEAGRGSELSMGTLVKAAMNGGWIPVAGGVQREQFIYVAPDNAYYYITAAQMWATEQSVNAAVGQVRDAAGNLIKGAEWIRANRLATSKTVDPGIDGLFQKGFDARDGSLIESEGGAVINMYRHPTVELGDARMATPWVEHVLRVFPKPGDADQFMNYMAHRRQRPEVKPRFALLIAGEQGIGKDTAIDMCMPALGTANLKNINPPDLDSPFNEYLSGTLVRVSEAANLHDMNKWAFNERLKVLIAGNPDIVTINPKYGHKYDMRMYCGVIITTNHLSSGIYIPTGDRRYDVIEGATLVEMRLVDAVERAAYFESLWHWFEHEQGKEHIAAFLEQRELKGWSAATGQRITAAHAGVVKEGMVQDHWLVDILDELGHPNAVRGDTIAAMVDDVKLKNELSSKMSNAMLRAGYVKAWNTLEKDGRWKCEAGVGASKKRATIFVRDSLSIADGIKAAMDLSSKF